MRCRNIFDIDNRLLLLARFLFLNFFRLRHSESLQVCQINHADAWHSSFVLILVTRNIIHRKSTIVHRIKGSLHTITADTDIARDFNHFPCNTLCSVTDVADVLVFFFLLFRFVLHLSHFRFLFFFRSLWFVPGQNLVKNFIVIYNFSKIIIAHKS